MHVAVDGRALRPGAARARGVARYLRCLLDELARAFPDDRYDVVDLGRLGLAAAAIAGRPRLDRLAGGCDVAWMPAPAPVALSDATPLVLTVHDLSFEHRPGDFRAYDRLWLRLARPARLARRAQRVICVSDATRRAVVEEWSVEPERALTVRPGPGRVAPEGAASSGGVTGAAAPEEPFFLAVGALEPRKLPVVTVDAHQIARARGLRAGLVFAGDGPLRDELGGARVKVLGHVPDALLDDLYERALAVVCASREEGFGFTPLEAAARGTPAVVADLPAFDETLGDAALRVPAGDAEALANALTRLESEPELRARLAAAAREAVRSLSWTDAARATRTALAAAANIKGQTL